MEATGVASDAPLPGGQELNDENLVSEVAQNMVAGQENVGCADGKLKAPKNGGGNEPTVEASPPHKPALVAPLQLLAQIEGPSLVDRMDDALVEGLA